MRGFVRPYRPSQRLRTCYEPTVVRRSAAQFTAKITTTASKGSTVGRYLSTIYFDVWQLRPKHIPMARMIGPSRICLKGRRERGIFSRVTLGWYNHVGENMEITTPPTCKENNAEGCYTTRIDAEMGQALPVGEVFNGRPGIEVNSMRYIWTTDEDSPRPLRYSRRTTYTSRRLHPAWRASGIWLLLKLNPHSKMRVMNQLMFSVFIYGASLAQPDTIALARHDQRTSLLL